MSQIVAPSFDEIRAILKEVSRGQQETRLQMQETDRLLKESKLETDRRIQENDRLFKESKQEADRRKQENDRRKQENDRRMQENDRLLKESKLENDRRMQETDRLLKESKLENDRRMQETDRLLKESKLETDRLRQETDRRRQEIDRQMQKSKLETENYIKETSRQIKKLQDMFSNKWGELVESLVSGRLLKLLKKRGIHINGLFFNRENNYTLIDGKKKYCEIDIIARNGHELVAVEVKSTLGANEVNRFLEVLRQFTLFFPEYKGRKIYGAVAYLKLYQQADLYAMRKGLFVIKATGDSACITNKADFKPLDFSPQ